MKENTKLKNVLAIGAHSDDIEIGCGGTIKKHVEAGDKVIILIIAESYYTNYDGTILRKIEDGVEEEKEAARVLGAEIINLGYKTKKVPYSSELIEDINKIIDKYGINIIYTHWSHDTHQDHYHTTKCVLAAGRYVDNILMYEPEYPAGRSYFGFRNQYYVDISESFETKMKALECHKSQVDKFGHLFLDAIEARAKHRGYEIKSEYAECFEIIRMKSNL